MFSSVSGTANVKKTKLKISFKKVVDKKLITC